MHERGLARTLSTHRSKRNAGALLGLGRRSILSALIITAAVALFSAPPAGAQTATGLKCKGCVKSKQIGNNGIKSADIKDGQVRSTDLAGNAVTSDKIEDGAVDTADLADNAVNSDKIADGAVGNADLASDAVTGDKIAPGAVGPDDILARTLVVGPAGDGSNTTANGMELLDAIAFLGGVSPAPSASNPWLVKLEPGIYDVGAMGVTLLPFVDLEGSGQGTTEIIGTVDGADPGFAGTVTTADTTELRHLTVTNTGGSANAIAIRVQGALTRISHVTAQASNGTTNNWGVLGRGCTELILTDVTATASGIVGANTGVTNQCGSLVATNLTATGVGDAFVQNGGTAVLRDSTVNGANSVVRASGTLNVAHSQLIGTVVPGTSPSGTFNCFGSYDQNLTAIGLC